MVDIMPLACVRLVCLTSLNVALAYCIMLKIRQEESMTVATRPSGDMAYNILAVPATPCMLTGGGSASSGSAPLSSDALRAFDSYKTESVDAPGSWLAPSFVLQARKPKTSLPLHALLVKLVNSLDHTCSKTLTNPGPGTRAGSATGQKRRGSSS